MFLLVWLLLFLLFPFSIIYAIVKFLRTISTAANNAEEVKESPPAEFNIAFQFREGELMIFKAIFDVCFAPNYKIGNIKPIESPQSHSYNEYALKKSDKYINIVNFVKRFGVEYTKEDLFKLKELLYEADFHFSENQVESLILDEKYEQDYLSFKKKLLSYLPLTFDNYLKAFILTFYAEIANLSKYSERTQKFGIYQDNTLAVNITTFTDENRKEESMSMSASELPDINLLVQNITRKLYYFKNLLQERKIKLLRTDNKDLIDKELVQLLISKKKQIELEKFKDNLIISNVYSIDKVDSMSGYEFEFFLRVLYDKMGYVVKQTKLSGDQGADLIISKFDENIAVQAKRSATKVGNKAIQEIAAAVNHYKTKKGIVISNNEFTSPAVELAKSNNIDLVNRAALEKLIKEYL